MPEPYQPIACDLHDILTDLSTRRQKVAIRYKDEFGTPQEARDTIADVFTRDKAEFLKLGRGEVIRLDYITHIDRHKFKELPAEGLPA